MLIRKALVTKIVENVVYFHVCDICGGEFSSSFELASCCSSACYDKLKERNRKNSIKRSTLRRKERRDTARKELPDTVCSHCQQSFRPLRNDAKFCSDKCKQSAYRERKKIIKPDVSHDAETVEAQVTQKIVTPEKSDKIKVLVFSSPSCGPCRTYKEELKKLENNKKFGETCEIDIMDVNENADLARSYGVQNIPTTIILDITGNKLDFIVGSMTATKLQRSIKNAKQ